MFRGLAALACLAVAGCASSKYEIPSAAAEEPIGNGYRMFARNDGATRVAGFVRAYDASGKLAVCEAFFIDAPEEEVRRFKRAMSDPNSYVELGDTARVSTVFAPIYQVAFDAERRLDPRGHNAKCGVTEFDWNETYRSAPMTLATYRTVVRPPIMNPRPTYTGRPRL